MEGLDTSILLGSLAIASGLSAGTDVAVFWGLMFILVAALAVIAAGEKS